MRHSARTMKYRVLLPEDYATSQRRYPVLYLLHGLGGDYKDWTTRTNIAGYSRTLPLIIVMPDGENSWYTNAAGAPAERFEDYILTDLLADVAGKYRTVNSRHGRTIAGLSMGGYGALKMALRRPATFAVAGSFSGAFSATRPELAKMIPSEQERLRRIYGDDDSASRQQNDLYMLAAAAKPGAVPYIYIDCGIADGLVTANREVVAALHKSGVAYEVPRGRRSAYVGVLGSQGSRVSSAAHEEAVELIDGRFPEAIQRIQRPQIECAHRPARASRRCHPRGH